MAFTVTNYSITVSFYLFSSPSYDYMLQKMWTYELFVKSFLKLKILQKSFSYHIGESRA